MKKSFREFMQGQSYMDDEDMGEEQDDIANTLAKLPPSHAKLVQGYKWKFHAGNTLNGDEDHVGYMDDMEGEIAVASPWNYGREFTVLHEIGHRVWENLVPGEMKRQWLQIVASTKERQNQNPEELFCMAYANHYAKNQIVIHDHDTWHRFIEALPK